MNAGSEAMLTVSHLSVSFGHVTALDDVSLSVEPGTISGLIGPNGSGKTTFVNAVMGQVKTSAGTLEIDGVRLDSLPSHRRRAQGITRTFQNLELSEALTVRETLEVAMYPLHPGRKELKEEVDRCATMFRLEPLLAEAIGRLPYGIRKQVEVARALLGSPKLVILDEAAAGLNPQAKTELADILLASHEAGRFAVLVIEHDMAFLQQLVSSVTVLDAGHVVATGTFDEIMRHEGVREAYLGVGLTSEMDRGTPPLARMTSEYPLTIEDQ